MMKTFSYQNDFLNTDDFDQLKNIIDLITENEWSLMNEEKINGAFWNSKRKMIDFSYQEIFAKKIHPIIDGFCEPSTAFNKVQRFFKNDVLGPLKDKEHVPFLKFACIYFVNSPSGSGINFPDRGEFYESVENSIIFYPAEELYEIRGSDTDKHFYHMTFFFN